MVSARGKPGVFLLASTLRGGRLAVQASQVSAFGIVGDCVRTAALAPSLPSRDERSPAPIRRG